MAGGSGPKMSRPTHGKIKDYPLKRMKCLETLEFNKKVLFYLWLLMTMFVIITLCDVCK